MPGFKLMLQDDKGEYPYSGRTLIFKGSMLVYDPQRDIVQWVPVRGMSSTLTMPELRAASNLNNIVPSPLSELLAKPSSTEIVKCIPAGAESDTDSSIVDSGDEWDKTESVGPLRSSTPTMKVGPTWVEVHVAAQEEEMAKSQAPSWEDILNTTPTEEGENWDVARQPVHHRRPVRRCYHRGRSSSTNCDRAGRFRSCSGGGAAHTASRSR